MILKKDYVKTATIERSREKLEDAIAYYFEKICDFAKEQTPENKRGIAWARKKMSEAVSDYRFWFKTESQKELTKRISEMKEKIKKEIFEENA